MIEGVREGLPERVGVLDGDLVGVRERDAVIVVVLVLDIVPEGVMDGVPDRVGEPERVPVTERDAESVGDGVCDTEAP